MPIFDIENDFVGWDSEDFDDVCYVIQTCWNYDLIRSKRYCSMKDFSKFSTHFHVPGVYFLRRKDTKKTIYIGQSSRIKFRINKHLNRFFFDEFSYIVCFDKDWRALLEAYYIHRIKPEYNKNFPSFSKPFEKVRLKLSIQHDHDNTDFITQLDDIDPINGPYPEKT